MAREYYLPYSDEDRVIWLKNFANKLPQYAGKYSITAEEVADMMSSAQFFSDLIDYKNQMTAYLAGVTNYKNAMRNGLKAGATLEPLMPPAPLMAAPVEPGIFGRATALVNRIKAHRNYSQADGENLGIIGAELSPIDTNTIKPTIILRLIGGGHPEIVWTRQGMTALEIQKLGSDGKWYFLAMDTVPNYTDMEALPSSGQSVVWQYRAIYRLKDERVGVWSDVVSVTVTG